MKNVKRISGNGILVETAGQKDFATFLGNQRSKEAGFVIGALAKKSSRIIIYDIPRMESRWRSNESLIEQNLNKNKEKFRQ